MNDGSIVAIVAIVFGCLYGMVALIVKSISGAARDKGGKGKDGSGNPSRDQQELFDLALRLQNRVETLEKLLDTTQPEWRGKP
jgi:phage shock protein B